MGVVTFDTTVFRLAYPQFADTEKWADARLTEAFEQACLVLDNTEASRVPYAPERGVFERATLLKLLVCHICTLWERGTVGATSSATEGSVSVSFAVPNIKNAEWYTQTPCGFSYWQAILKYRTGGKLYNANITHSGF